MYKKEKMFQQGGVSHNPQGYAQGAVQPYGGGFGMLAQLQMLKGFEGSGSYSSSSSKVKIVKYDDEFGKGWCATNLKKPGVGAAPGVGFTEDEIKKNPPLALKFGDKDCNVLVPIPSHEAMCTTSKAMLSTFLGTGLQSEDVKKKGAEAISKALLYNYVSDCGHSDQALTPQCFAAQDLVTGMPVQSRAEHKKSWMQRTGQNSTDYDALAVGIGPGDQIDPNFFDRVDEYK